jgi:hypothetical protein
MRSSLAHLAPMAREIQPDQAWNAASQAWHRDGLILLNPDEIEKRVGWVAARDARNLAELCFGKRKAE